MGRLGRGARWAVNLVGERAEGGGVVIGVGWLRQLLEILGRQAGISRGSVSGGVALPVFKGCDVEDVAYTAGV